MTTYPLGRRHASDPRDAAYPMAAILNFDVAVPTYRYWSGFRTHLNQTGDTCVANAWTHLLCDSPRSHRLADVDMDAPGWGIPGSASDTWNTGYVDVQSGETGFRGWLYHAAQTTDEFSDTPPAGGTSVRAAAKILQQLGVLSAYHWAQSIDDIAMAILTTGPVVVGTPWYNQMFSPQGVDAMLVPAGGVAGGHAWKVDGLNQTTGIYRMKNSWSASWGLNGYAHITKANLELLVFGGSGEAAIGVEA